MVSYVLVEVGCLECGGGSTLIGTFATQEEAVLAAPAVPNWGKWETPPLHPTAWRGQAAQVVFDLDRPGDAVAVRFW